MYKNIERKQGFDLFSMGAAYSSKLNTTPTGRKKRRKQNPDKRHRERERKPNRSNLGIIGRSTWRKTYGTF